MTRLTVALVAVIVALSLALGWLMVKGNPWKARAVVAEQGQALATETGQITERTLVREPIIIREAEGAAHVVETAPGAETPVPPDVLAGWRAGVDGLRERSQAPDGDDPR